LSQSEEIVSTETEVNREIARRTRRSFVVGGAAAAAGYGLWHLAGSGAEDGHLLPTLRLGEYVQISLTPRQYSLRAGLGHRQCGPSRLAPAS
jgi:hypothetical protein